MNPEELALLRQSIQILSSLDPENCSIGPPVMLSSRDTSLTVDLSSPSPDAWVIVKKAIILNIESKGWAYTSDVIQEPFPGFIASCWIPGTQKFYQVASRYSEGYSLIQSYIGLLPPV